MFDAMNGLLALLDMLFNKSNSANTSSDMLCKCLDALHDGFPCQLGRGMNHSSTSVYIRMADSSFIFLAYSIRRARFFFGWCIYARMAYWNI